jgi:hypothetical protein
MISGQTNNNYKVYQYINNDTTNKTLVLTREFDKSGLLTKEIYSGFKDHHKEDGLFCTVQYSYKDKLLIESIACCKSDSIKQYYYYNAKNNILKREEYKYKRHLKEDINPKDVYIYDSENYESEKKWKKTLEETYIYYGKGRIKDIYRPKINDYQADCRITYEYDKKGRLNKIKTYINEEPYSYDIYNYLKNSYTITSFKNESFNGDNSISKTTEIKTDRLNRIIQKTEIRISVFLGEYNTYTTDITYEYNKKRLIKEIIKYENIEPSKNTLISKDYTLTHIYVYEISQDKEVLIEE